MKTGQTETNPAINYEWYLTGSQAARFILYPIRDKHTELDVKNARLWLYRQRDVASMQVRWRKLNDDTPPPENIPDFIIIKELKIELGKKEAYIQELKEELLKKDVNQKRQLKKEIQSEPLYIKLKEQYDKARKEIGGLRKNISDLITKLNQKQ